MHSKQLNMPVCKYEVLDGSPTGPPVYFATVGQMVSSRDADKYKQKHTTTIIDQKETNFNHPVFRYITNGHATRSTKTRSVCLFTRVSLMMETVKEYSF